VLTIWQLYAVGFTAGFLNGPVDVADQSYLPVLLDPEDLVEGNASSRFPPPRPDSGPGFAGGLIASSRLPFAIFIDAASFVASAV